MKHNCRTLALRISLKADAKRPSRAACSSVSRASQNGALLNILWSILKQFEAVWNSLNSRSRNSLKQSEADWSQTQYYMAQLRSLTTQGLHFSLLGINLLNLSHRHSTNHTLELLRGQKQDLQMPKKHAYNILQQPTFEMFFTNDLQRIIKPDLIQTILKPYQTIQNITQPYPKKHGIHAVGLEDKKNRLYLNLSNCLSHTRHPHEAQL